MVVVHLLTQASPYLAVLREALQAQRVKQLLIAAPILMHLASLFSRQSLKRPALSCFQQTTELTTRFHS